MDTIERIKKQAISPEKIDETNPCFGIVVCPSAFTVPQGWEFVLKQPFEGVSYIATVLHNAGYKVKIIDVRWVDNPVGTVLKELLIPFGKSPGFNLGMNGDFFKAGGSLGFQAEGAPHGVDVLGIATYEDGFAFIEELVACVKQAHPNMPVILGGSLVTSMPSVVMQNTLADIAVLGEGELTILELMDLITNGERQRIGEIPGICHKDSFGNLIFTEKRPQMKDLNSLPAMNLSLWPQVQENPVIKEVLFSHSRGCYMNCSFCYRTTPQLSLKSVDKLKKELQELKDKHKVEFIYFVDLTFAIEKERALAVCEVLKEFNVRWSCMCRVQNLDAEILKKMKEAGCQVILYGFESLDENILNKAHKGISPDEIKNMVYLTQDSGIQVAGLFILGLPGETKESLARVMEFIKQSAGACRVKYLSAIPGTEIYRAALEKGIIKNEASHLRWLSREKGQVDDEFLNFTELPDEELRGAFKQISSMYIKGPCSYEAWA